MTRSTSIKGKRLAQPTTIKYIRDLDGEVMVEVAPHQAVAFRVMMQLRKSEQEIPADKSVDTNVGRGRRKQSA